MIELVPTRPALADGQDRLAGGGKGKALGLKGSHMADFHFGTFDTAPLSL